MPNTYNILEAAIGSTTPAAHNTTHENGGSDEINVDGLSGLLADSQTPLAHKTSHQSGGSDAIKLDDLAAPDDNTDLNSSTSAHGLLKKLSNTSTEFMNGQGNWATPASGGGNLLADFTQTGNGTTVETDLFNQNIPAATLGADKDVLEFSFHGTRANTSNIKTFRIYLGTTLIYTYNYGSIGTPLSPRTRHWQIEGKIIRTGATSQKCFARFVTGETLSPEMAFGYYATASETLANALALRFTGQSSAASNDIVYEFGMARKIGAP